MRINVNIPEALFRKATGLVDNGLFSNFSELVRDGLRKEVKEYEDSLPGLDKEEKRLFLMLRDAEKKGLLLDEEEMEKHGLKI